MFLMREGLQCRISTLKHCLMRLWNYINQLTFVFPFAETRSIKWIWRQLTERIWCAYCVYLLFKLISYYLVTYVAVGQATRSSASFVPFPCRFSSPVRGFIVSGRLQRLPYRERSILITDVVSSLLVCRPMNGAHPSCRPTSSSAAWEGSIVRAPRKTSCSVPSRRYHSSLPAAL